MGDLQPVSEPGSGLAQQDHLGIGVAGRGSSLLELFANGGGHLAEVAWNLGQGQMMESPKAMETAARQSTRAWNAAGSRIIKLRIALFNAIASPIEVWGGNWLKR